MGVNSLGSVLRHLRKLRNAEACRDLDDVQLLARFATGREEAAFAMLVQRHGPMVHNVCRRLLNDWHAAEDAFQAVFLVLARRCTSIRRRGSLASWLYGVALRVASKARVREARRRTRERQARQPRCRDVLDELTWQELRSVLDEEIGSLPERYRAPILLCYFEGKSYDQAAGELGWPKSSLSNRLHRALDQLRQRLVRRGITLSAAVLATALTRESAAAALPALVALDLVKAASLLLAGKAVGSTVSPQAIVLAEQSMKGLLAFKAKILILLLVSGMVAGGAGLASYQASSERPAANAPEQALPKPPQAGAPLKAGAPIERAPDRAHAIPVIAAPLSPDKITLHGMVLDVTGKPLAGAKLLLVGANARPLDLGLSAADGRFAVVVPKSAINRDPNRNRYAPRMFPSRESLVAQIDGAGFPFAALQGVVPTAPIRLRMVRDLPIRGRVLNTEGKPVAGAKVAAVFVSVDNSLGSVLGDWNTRNPSAMARFVADGIVLESSSFLSTTTDIDGRFRIVGAGAERLVHLGINAAGIADAEVLVVNRDGFDPKPYNGATADNVAKMRGAFFDRRLLNGPDFAVAAEAERLIRGVVQDVDMGKPRAGAKLWLRQSLYFGLANMRPCEVSVVTDTQGRYEIHGTRKVPTYTLEVPADPASGFVGSRIDIRDTPGYEPIAADIKVTQGVIITGHVIDAATKESLRGFATVNVLAGNAFAKDYPGFEPFMRHGGSVTTREDGTFRVVTIPGPVVLMGGVDAQRMPQGPIAWLSYKPAAADPKYPKFFAQTGIDGCITVHYGLKGEMNPLQGQFCKVLEVQPGTAVLKQDIIVEPEIVLPVRIQDGDGRPLTGTWVTGDGLRTFFPPSQVKSDFCFAYHLNRNEPRLMVFYERTKNLAGTLRLKGDETKPATVRLGQPGKVKGRALDGDGKPLPKVVVNLDFHDRTAAEMHNLIQSDNVVETDVSGRFQFDHVIPGSKLLPRFTQGRHRLEPETQMEPRAVEADAVLDFGELKVRPKAGD